MRNTTEIFTYVRVVIQKRAAATHAPIRINRQARAIRSTTSSEGSVAAIDGIVRVSNVRRRHIDVVGWITAWFRGLAIRPNSGNVLASTARGTIEDWNCSSHLLLQFRPLLGIW